MIEITTLGGVIKQTYEDEPNTNAFTNAEKQKLANLSKVASTGSFRDLLNVPNLVELDESGTIPTRLLNLSSLSFKGAWNASTNTPSLVNGTGAVGDFYKVSVAGTFNFGNGDFTFGVGDWVIFAAGVWQRIGVHEMVSSVNGKVGLVILSAADVGAKPSDYVPTYAELTGKPDFDSIYQKKHRGTISPPIVAGLFRKNANQAFSQNSSATVSWQVSVYDQFNIRNNNSFTIPAWAKYARVSGHLQWGGQSGSGGGPLYGQVLVNGSAAVGCSPNRIFGNINVLSNSLLTGIFPVKSGDVITLSALQNTGATRNIEFGSSGQGTWLQIELFE